VLVVGTDPNEWFNGRETVIRVFREQVEAMGGSWPIEARSPVGYILGDSD